MSECVFSPDNRNAAFGERNTNTSKSLRSTLAERKRSLWCLYRHVKLLRLVSEPEKCAVVLKTIAGKRWRAFYRKTSYIQKNCRFYNTFFVVSFYDRSYYNCVGKKKTADWIYIFTNMFLNLTVFCTNAASVARLSHDHNRKLKISREIKQPHLES